MNIKTEKRIIMLQETIQHLVKGRVDIDCYNNHCYVQIIKGNFGFTYCLNNDDLHHFNLSHLSHKIVEEYKGRILEQFIK